MSKMPASLAEQQDLVARIAALIVELEEKADPFIAGHCLHLRERAEVIGEILETDAASVAAFRSTPV
ncbi:hypothetical protein FHS85_001019 [Rhodoligotrophos appendicifer]|uniref:hypothetical protein n=1 Tax=Rhodoligotrophos appendicifer TaxID=987056 RepID=UPI00117D0A97|nr:hypothetical protein [Rhodoligotrophos appendicifer]